MAAICSSESKNSAPAHDRKIRVQPMMLIQKERWRRHTIRTFNLLRGIFVDNFGQPATQDLRGKLVLALKRTSPSDTKDYFYTVITHLEHNHQMFYDINSKQLQKLRKLGDTYQSTQGMWSLELFCNISCAEHWSWVWSYVSIVCKVLHVNTLLCNNLWFTGLKRIHTRSDFLLIFGAFQIYSTSHVTTVQHTTQ